MKLHRPAPSSPSPTVSAATRTAAAPALATGLGARGDFLSRPVQRKDALPDGLRNSLEALSGVSLDHVKVRYNSKAPGDVGANAYTKGAEIHIARGQEEHLAHEAWHVVQQARRRVRATGKVAGQALNDDPRLEHEADVMGARAERMAASSTAPSAPVSAPAAPTPTQNPIQGDWATDKLREEAQAVANPYATEGYTLHHKVAKSRLNTLAALAEATAGPEVTAFKAKVSAVTHHSARNKSLAVQLGNMPANIEYGPGDDHRTDKPGTTFDPNTVPVPPAVGGAVVPALATDRPDVSLTPDITGIPAPALAPDAQPAPRLLTRRLSVRSLNLKVLDDKLTSGVPLVAADWTAMTNALTAAEAAHVAMPGTVTGKLSPPRQEQWVAHGPVADGYQSHVRKGGSLEPGVTASIAVVAAQAKAAAEAAKAERLRIYRQEEAIRSAAIKARAEKVEAVRKSIRKSAMGESTFRKHAEDTDLTPAEIQNIVKGLGSAQKKKKFTVKAADVAALTQTHFGKPKPAEASGAAVSSGASSSTAEPAREEDQQ